MNESEAQLVRVDFGQDAVANFSMIPARRVRVSGFVRNAEGRPASGMRMTLNERRGAANDQIDVSMLSADGSFTFEHVLPGRYLLHVRPSFEQRQTMPAHLEWAAMHVNVNGEDISDLMLATSPGFAVSGRAIFEALTAPPATKVTLGAREMDLSLQSLGLPQTATNSALDAAGRFRIVGVRGKVRVFGGGGGWFVKRVLLKGNDVTTGFDVSGDVDGIEVVLTDRTTTVTGTVRDTRGIGRNDFIVTFFPVGQFDGQDRASRQRTIRPDPDGVYRIRNLPPGDYLAAAVPAMSLPLDGEVGPGILRKSQTGGDRLYTNGRPDARTEPGSNRMTTIRRFPAAALLLLMFTTAAAAQAPGPGRRPRSTGTSAWRTRWPLRRHASPRQRSDSVRDGEESAAASSPPTRARRSAARKSTSTRARRNSTGASRPTARGATNLRRCLPGGIAFSSTRPDTWRSSTDRRDRSRPANRSISPTDRRSRKSTSACRAAARLPAASPMSLATPSRTSRSRRSDTSSSTASVSWSAPGDPRRPTIWARTESSV